MRVLSFGVALFFSIAASADTKTFDSDVDANIECKCVARFPGCVSKVLDALGGKQRHDWVQQISVKKGMSLDLNEVCYRKRDVDGLGGGLCCPGMNESDTIKKLFRGKLQGS